MTVPIYTQPIEENRALQSRGTDAIPAGLGDVLGATFEDSLARSPIPSIWNWSRRLDAFQSGTPLSADEANQKYGIDGKLRFDAPVYEAVAQDLNDRRRAELQRQDILARSAGGLVQGAAQLGVGFVAGLLDPLNVAASLIPVVGEARMARMLEQAGSAAGRAAVRAEIGAVQGAIGAAVVEPIIYGVAQQEQADYHATDSLLNIAFGTVLGGGLHVVGGAIGDHMKPGRWMPPVQAVIESRAWPEQEAAMRSAVAAVAEDRPVQAELVLAGGTTPRRRMGGRSALSDLGTVFDSDRTRIDVRYELTDLAKLVTSNTDDFTVNPNYPAELQPRQRDRAAGQAQIADIVSRFQPERLGRSPDASTGAPIVGPDNVVESGNGRTMALRRIYAQAPDTAAEYKAWLTRQGYSLQGLEQPALIARRLSPLDGDARRRFTVAAQRSGTLTLSAAEQAMADARQMDSILHLHEGGDVGRAGNARFVSAFVDKLPQADQGAMTTTDGRLSLDGARRIDAALLARAFDAPDLLGRMLETADDGNRALAGALLDVAPAWARMRAAVAAGEVSPHVDATGDLLDAVRMIRDARAAGRPLSQLLSQIDAFDRPSPATEMFLSRMLRGKTTASREAIGEALTRYVDEAMKTSAGRDLLGAEPPRASDILDALKRNDPLAPPPDDAEAVVRVVRALDDAGAADTAVPRPAVEHPADPVEGDLEALRRTGLIGPEEPELIEAARLTEDADSQARAIGQGALCMARRMA